MVYQTIMPAKQRIDMRKRRKNKASPDAAEAGGSGQTVLGPLPSYVGYALRRAQSASFRHLERSAAAVALTPGQFSLLIAIEANPGLNQRRLADMFALDKSTLSPAMDALAKRGLVQRTRMPEDGRAWSLTLTPEGRQTLARMKAKVEAQESIMAGILNSGERRRLVDVLRRIEAALDAADL